MTFVPLLCYNPVMHEKTYRLLQIKEELLPVEKAFVEHVQNRDELSPPQAKVINNIYRKYFESDWLNTYDTRKRRIAVSCAQYWVSNPPKHSKLAAKILNDPSFIPSREEYKTICECKEARNFLNPGEATPLYPAGSLVRIIKQGINDNFKGKLGAVIGVSRKDKWNNKKNELLSCGFSYQVLPQGEGNTILFDEKDLEDSE